MLVAKALETQRAQPRLCFVCPPSVFVLTLDVGLSAPIMYIYAVAGETLGRAPAWVNKNSRAGEPETAPRRRAPSSAQVRAERKGDNIENAVAVLYIFVGRSLFKRVRVYEKITTLVLPSGEAAQRAALD